MIGAVVLDSLARPRAGRPPGLRSLEGIWLLWLLAGLPFGLFLAFSGNAPVAALLALALVGLFTMISNAKHAMLGEALVFSDLALLGAVFRHPQFYFSALTKGQKALLALAAPVVPLLLWAVFEPDLAAHLAGLAVLGGSALLLGLSLRLRPWAGMARLALSEADVARHGLIPTVFLYWRGWRESADPVAAAPLAGTPAPDELLVFVQCESYADPCALFGDPALALPGLTAARQSAWAHGALEVSGFGAYTMRTEYGVLFGRSDGELGFRRFDPFLTATREASHALPARLAPSGWRSLFVHPHDMRFYNRESIMTAGGFAELVGQDQFAPPTVDEGRYVTDAAIAARILALAQTAQVPTLIYAVTIENHGPWKAHGTESDLRASYLKLLARSDAMLRDLMDGLAALRRPAMLVFFGDHRPSIPGVCTPGEERHTPFVVLRFDRSGALLAGHEVDQRLTPAQLHHYVAGLVTGAAITLAD